MNCAEKFWQLGEGISNLYWTECLVAKRRVLIHEVKVTRRFQKINTRVKPVHIYLYIYILFYKIYIYVNFIKEMF